MKNWVSANISLYKKGEKGLGISHENWNIGKNKETELSLLLVRMVTTTVDFYIKSIGLDNVPEQLEQFKQVVSSMEITQP